MSEEEWVDVPAPSSDQSDWKDVPSSDKAVAEKPSIGSEALKVAGQAAAGASQGLLDVGNKPFSELQSGEVGSKLDEGYLIGQKIKSASREDIASTIKRFVESGPVGIMDAMEVPRTTLASKYGFPTIPQPETGVGKVLGIVANVAAQGATLGALEGKLSPNSNLKLPKTSQIDEAISKIDRNVSDIKETNRINKFKTQDGIDVNKLEQNIRDNQSLSNLENEKSNTSYAQAEAIHGDPVESRNGNVGLGLQASKNLNKAYWKDAEPHFNKEIYVEDAIDSVKVNLQKHGILDAQGDIVKGIETNPDQVKALKFYQELKPVDAEGEVQTLPKKMKVGELKSKLDSVFGNNQGSDLLKNQFFQSAVDTVKELKDVNAKYVTDYQARNGVFQKFNIFNKIGWAKGDVSLNSGASALENVAHENPSMVNRDNVKLMDFIKKYTGNDPSEPIRKISGKISMIKNAAQSRDIASRILMQNMDRDIFNTNLKADQNARSMKESLGRLYDSAKTKEANIALKKKIALEVAGIASLTEGARYLGKKVLGK